MKSNLDDQQRKEEDYHKKLWKDRKKCIEEWFKVDENNQQMIDGIIQDQTSQQIEDNSDDNREET